MRRRLVGALVLLVLPLTLSGISTTALAGTQGDPDASVRGTDGSTVPNTVEKQGSIGFGQCPIEQDPGDVASDDPMGDEVDTPVEGSYETDACLSKSSTKGGPQLVPVGDIQIRMVTKALPTGALFLEVQVRYVPRLGVLHLGGDVFWVLTNKTTGRSIARMSVLRENQAIHYVNVMQGDLPMTIGDNLELQPGWGITWGRFQGANFFSHMPSGLPPTKKVFGAIP